MCVARATDARTWPSQQLQGYFRRYLTVPQIKQLSAATQSGIAAAPAQEPEQRSPKSRNYRYLYKERRQAKEGAVVVEVGKYREHSDEAA